MQEENQRDLFEKLDKEYQFARMVTHTHRGVGLGFGSVPTYQAPTVSQQSQPPTSSA